MKFKMEKENIKTHVIAKFSSLQDKLKGSSQDELYSHIISLYSIIYTHYRYGYVGSSVQFIKQSAACDM